MSRDPTWVDIVGAVGAVAVGVAAVFFAGMQTRIARRQNKISESLTDLEKRRDEPRLIVESFDLKPAEGGGGFHCYDVEVRLRNVGGGTAWGIRVDRIRLWIQPGAGPRGPLLDGDTSRDICLDVAEDPQRPRLLRTLAPNETAVMVVPIASRINFTYAPIVDVEVLLGRMNTVAADSVAWRAGHRPASAWSGDQPPDGHLIGRMVPTNDRERFKELNPNGPDAEGPPPAVRTPASSNKAKPGGQGNAR